MFRWLRDRFARRPAGTPGDARDDWRAGDLAECIATGGWYGLQTGEPASGPELGQILVVAAVVRFPAPLPGKHFAGLGFSRFGPRTYQMDCFRKIVPRADAIEACEAEFARFVRQAPATAPQPAPAEQARERQPGPAGERKTDA